MARIAPFRPFVERNLAAWLEVPQVEPDDDGRYEFGCGPTSISVGLNDDVGTVFLEFRALLARKPRKAPARVLGLLNDLNSCQGPVRVFRLDDELQAAWIVPVATMDDDQFQELCGGFCAMAGSLSQTVVEELGAEPPNDVLAEGHEVVDA